MYNKYWYFIFVSFWYSCSRELPDDPLMAFSSEQTTHVICSNKIDLEQYNILKPASVLKCADGYVIRSQVDKNLFSRIFLSQNQVISGVNKGNAPGELLSPSSLQSLDEDVIVYDISRKAFFNVQENLEDSILVLSEYKSINLEGRPFMINLLSNGKMMASGFFHNSWISYFGRENNLLSGIPFPIFEETDMLSNAALSTLYLSTLISLKPNGKKMVCATQKCGVLSFCSIACDTIIVYKQMKYYPPKLNMPKKNNGLLVVYSRDNKVGFCGLASDNQHVFVLYSGRTFDTHNNLSHHCEHLLVYDWDGNPIKHFILDKPLYTMSYDIEHRIIYGIGYDPEGVILEYELKGIL